MGVDLHRVDPIGVRTCDIGLDKYDGYIAHPSEFRQKAIHSKNASKIIAKPMDK